MKTVSLQKLFDTTKSALLAGGMILKRGHSQQRKISYKTPISPVTQVDLASEKKIISLIRKRFPQHLFLAEESAHIKKADLGSAAPDRYRWVIDPLDGTVNFIHRIPQFCVSVAVERKGVILAGGVYDPCRDELFLAAKGKGATLNGRKIRVSAQKKMVRSLLITGFPYDRDKNFERYLAILRPFLKNSGGIRRFGSAALDLAWVAAGRAEGYWESGLQPWDVAGGWILVKESGGKVSRFNGTPYSLENPDQTLASNGYLHSSMVKVFKSKNLNRFLTKS